MPRRIHIEMKAAFALLVVVCAACGAITPAPVSGSPLTTSQLKFRVMDAAGKPVFCDPDFYPVAREGGEEANAIAQYPAIKADAEAYGAIAAHEGLPAGDLTDAEKLTLYRAWKLLGALKLTPAGGGESFQYRVQAAGPAAGYQMVAGTVRVDGFVTVSSRSPAGPPMCPICLAASTTIATPEGAVSVTDVKPGMVVWTVRAGGARVAEPVLETGSMAAPPGHLMVHLRLADGRELLVSPGHPTADGRSAGALRAGEPLDGSTVLLWELVPYTADRTYDILPAGGTGEYWANGILMGSTLAR